ncbi:sulfotransferase family protein [Salinispora fenicalii]|uniref:sulfotransferase family protein n=1 Tax=Salinispora fenicalii TaxID=1137263 RepID=UPI000484767B|nr:sulfotransferase family protein [Salinispora fenicalii]
MLRLINTGLGRTGTTSLKVALERLGYGPCYHMFDIVNDSDRLRQWEKVVCEGQHPDWEALFNGFTSVVDGPSAVYHKEIIQAFPEAKVILTIRDGEEWYRSTYGTLYQFALRNRDNPPEPGSMPARMYRFVNTMVWDGLFGGRFTDKEHAINVFRRHNEEVANFVAPDNLLIYDVQQGWEPLCAFLGVTVPAENFPHANDGESMRRVIREASGGAAGATTN